MFDKKVVEGRSHGGVGAFGLRAQVIIKDGRLFANARIGVFVPHHGIETFDIAATLFIIESREDIAFVGIVDLDLNFVEDAVGAAYVADQEAVRRSALAYEGHTGDIVVAAAAHITAKYELSIVVQLKIREQIVAFFHRKKDAVPVELLQVLIVQERGEKKMMGIFAVDLEDHDPLFVLADDGSIDLIVGGEADLGRIELDGFAHLLGLAIEFYGRAVDDILTLVFIDKIAMIGIGYEIDVDVAIRHERQGYALHQVHGAIVDADGAIGVIVLENQIVTTNLSNDLEIGPAAVFPFRFGVGDQLDLGFEGRDRQGQR